MCAERTKDKIHIDINHTFLIKRTKDKIHIDINHTLLIKRTKDKKYIDINNTLLIKLKIGYEIYYTLMVIFFLNKDDYELTMMIKYVLVLSRRSLTLQWYIIPMSLLNSAECIFFFEEET